MTAAVGAGAVLAVEEVARRKLSGSDEAIEEPEEPDSRFHLWYPSPLKLAGEVLPNWRRTPAESGPEL